MRAAVATAYGPPSVVTIHELAKPSAGAEQVIVRVEAAGVNTADTRIRGASFPDGMGLLARLATGITKPRKPVLGGSFAGVLESIGADVHGVTVGDRVCGGTGFAMGCHAEFVAPRPAMLFRYQMRCHMRTLLLWCLAVRRPCIFCGRVGLWTPLRWRVNRF